MIKICISVTSHALDPPPSVTNCHTFSDPLPPSSVTYSMDGPFVQYHLYRLIIKILPQDVVSRGVVLTFSSKGRLLLH